MATCIRLFNFFSFSAYLRGIETQRSWNYGHVQDQSFQPTYEELKHISIMEALAGIFSFQPTYEELKPSFGGGAIIFLISVFSLPTRNWNSPDNLPDNIVVLLSFQPTYEELKLWKIFLDNSRSQSFQPTYEELKHYWDYNGACWGCWFSAYLRGIETEVFPGRVFAHPRFQPTYEELKQIVLPY